MTSAGAPRSTRNARDGVERKLCTFTLEPEPGQAVYPVGGEAIILGDTVVGFTTTANFGHAIVEADRLRLRRASSISSARTG